ncbi:MAG: TRAP transporter substrate-binding protein [Lachnospiraceae bacterium]|nr:TRAP transporter substrate-binding protein [Lachnospiraceae bacterium]
MKRIVALLTIMAMSVTLLAGCGGGSGSESPAPATEEKGDAGSGEAAGAEEKTEAPENTGKTYEVALSTPNMDGTPIANACYWFAEEVNTRTNGQITVNVFSNSALGAQKDMFAQLSMGGVELVADGTLVVDYYAPEYGFLAAPFALTGRDHLKALIDSPIFEGFQEKLAQSNILMGGVTVKASRKLCTAEKYIYDGSNASQMVIRTPDNSLYVKAWEAVGASVQVMGGGEVYSSIQTGVINATEGDWSQLDQMKMAEVAKYLYETAHVTEFGSIFISKDWYDSLPEDLAEIVMSTAEEAMDRATEEAEAMDADHLKSLLEGGMEMAEIDPKPMFDAVAPVWKEMYESTWTAATYDEVMSYAK